MFVVAAGVAQDWRRNFSVKSSAAKGGNLTGRNSNVDAIARENARKVILLIRGQDLGKDMSDYLLQRVLDTKNIELLTNTEITAMFGDGHFEAIELKNDQSGNTKKINVAGVFSFIGAIPRTAWLPPQSKRMRRALSKQ